MKLNHILLKGSVAEDVNTNPKRYKIKLYGNNLIIKKHKFDFFLKRYVPVILKNIDKILSREYSTIKEEETYAPLIEGCIINSHYSTQLKKVEKNVLIEDIIPWIENTIELTSADISQEVSTNTPLDVTKSIRGQIEKTQFIAIKLTSEICTIKFQLNNRKYCLHRHGGVARAT